MRTLGKASGRCSGLHIVVDTIVVFFGFWTIYCNAFSFWNLSFHSLSRFSFIPLLFSCLLFFAFIRFKKSYFINSQPVVGSRLGINIPEHFKWLTAMVIVFLFFITASLFLFWCLSLCYLALLHFEASTHKEDHASCNLPRGRDHFLSVMGIAFLAALLTLLAHRPDADDASYLNLIVSALDFPNQPFLTYDGIHGILNIPLNTPTYCIHSYEMFVAFLADICHLSPIFVYHLVLPPLFAVFVIIANYLVLQKFYPQNHLWGLIFVFLIILFWGDAHRTFSNFSLIRLFQGKAIMVSAYIPLVYFYAVEFVQKRSMRCWLMLFLVQIGAVGFSSSALVAAPLALSFVLLGAWRPNKNQSKVLFLGLLSSIYVVVIGLSLTPDFGSYPGFDVKTASTDFCETDPALDTVMGDGWLKYFGLFSILAFAIQKKRSLYLFIGTGIPLVGIALLFSPWSSDFISKTVVGNMSWRMFWALPFPLIMGMAAVNISSVEYRFKGVRAGPILYCLAIILCSVYSQQWTISNENKTTMSLPYYKVDEYYMTAKAVNALTPDKGLVLAPFQVAKWLPTFREYPYVIYSRKMYLGKLRRFMGEKERQIRENIHGCINGEDGYELYLPLVFEEIKRRNINTIVFRKDLPWGDTLNAELKMLKYRNQPFKNYNVWISQDN